jgi:4-hydroxy-3-methylbut-2-enyl diphosphate reductase
MRRAIIAALHRRYPDMIGPDTRDICYATQNRQTAVREVAKRVDLLLVVGAGNSSNSNRLREIGAEQGVPCHLVPDAEVVQRAWLHGVATLGITAGASCPNNLIEDTIYRVFNLRGTSREEVVAAATSA